MTEVVRVSYSELMDARRCSFKHWLNWQRGWRRPQPPDSALGLGIAWHKVLNAYYDGLRGYYKFKQVYTLSGGIKGGWHAGIDTIEQQDEGIQDQLRWMLEGYAAHYGREPGWVPLATEEELIVTLPQLFDDLIVKLKVKIDLIIKDKYSNVWVDDHKTCTQLPQERKQNDPQLPLYMYAMQQSDWVKPFGARYSYTRKPSKTYMDWPLDKRFRRKLVSHTDKEIYSVACDAYKSIYTRYFESRIFDKPPRSLTPDCSFCDYYSPCKASRKGYNLEEFLSDEGFVSNRDELKMPKEAEE